MSQGINETADPEDEMNEPDEDTEEDGFEEPPAERVGAIPEDDQRLFETLPRVIIAASSNWTNHATIEREIGNWWEANNFIPVSVQIGDCPIGGEPMALVTMQSLGMRYTVWNADTITPLQRDRAMVASGADVAFVFIENASEGASRVRDMCIGAGIPTIVCTKETVRPKRRFDSQ